MEKVVLLASCFLILCQGFPAIIPIKDTFFSKYDTTSGGGEVREIYGRASILKEQKHAFVNVYFEPCSCLS